MLPAVLACCNADFALYSIAEDSVVAVEALPWNTTEQADKLSPHLVTYQSDFVVDGHGSL